MFNDIQLVAITLEDDSLVVLQFFINEYDGDGAIRQHIEPTDENIEKEIQKANYSVKSWRRITKEELPQDRTFRDAWVDSKKSIEHDIEKVKNIHLQHLREEREPRLELLDKQWMKFTGQGKTAEAIVIENERQRLRDIPETVLPRLNKAKTIEEVKSITL